MLLSRYHYKLSFLLFSELEDQPVDPPNNLYFGAKHIPLFSQRPFHYEFVSLFFFTLFLVLIQTQYGVSKTLQV